jgi:hypothetical protein
MTDKSQVPRKLSLASAYRRVATLGAALWAVFDRLDRPAPQMMSLQDWERAPLTWARSEGLELPAF